MYSYIVFNCVVVCDVLRICCTPVACQDNSFIDMYGNDKSHLISFYKLL